MVEGRPGSRVSAAKTVGRVTTVITFCTGVNKEVVLVGFVLRKGVDCDINLFVDLVGIVLGVTVLTIFLVCSSRSPCNLISTIAIEDRRCCLFSA